MRYVLYAAISLMGLTLLSLAILHSFIFNPDQPSWLLEFGIVLGLPPTIVFALGIYFAEPPSTTSGSQQPKRSPMWLSIPLGIFASMLMFGIFPVQFGAPCLLHFLTGHHFETTAPVTEYHREYHKGYIYYLHSPAISSDPREALKIKKAVYDDLKPGSLIHVIGTRSRFGIYVSHYDIIDPSATDRANRSQPNR